MHHHAPCTWHTLDHTKPLCTTSLARATSTFEAPHATPLHHHCATTHDLNLWGSVHATPIHHHCAIMHIHHYTLFCHNGIAFLHGYLAAQHCVSVGLSGGQKNIYITETWFHWQKHNGIIFSLTVFCTLFTQWNHTSFVQFFCIPTNATKVRFHYTMWRRIFLKIENVGGANSNEVGAKSNSLDISTNEFKIYGLKAQ